LILGQGEKNTRGGGGEGDLSPRPAINSHTGVHNNIPLPILQEKEPFKIFGRKKKKKKKTEKSKKGAFFINGCSVSLNLATPKKKEGENLSQT